MKSLLLVALSLAACVAPSKEPTPASGPPVVTSRVEVGDARVRATGRIDRRTAGEARFAYSGVAFEIAFRGEGLLVELDDQSQSDPKRANHYQVVIDGKPTLDLPVRPGVHEYTLAQGLPHAEHRVTLYKKTEAIVGRGAVLSFALAGSRAKLLDLPARPARRLEIVGDSITCGYGNEASFEAPPRGNPSSGFTAENEDHYRAYGALAARELGAELYTECISGIGVTRDYGGKAADQMPGLFGRSLPFDPDAAWDFESYQPDALIVNLGTNDFGQGVPDQVAFEQAYEAFLVELRRHYPRAQLTCLTGPMLTDFWPAGEERLTKINRWVSAVVERRHAQGDARVSFLALAPQTPPYGEDWHPTLDTHTRMAGELTSHLRQQLGW